MHIVVLINFFLIFFLNFMQKLSPAYDVLIIVLEFWFYQWTDHSKLTYLWNISRYYKIHKRIVSVFIEKKFYWRLMLLFLCASIQELSHNDIYTVCLWGILPIFCLKIPDMFPDTTIFGYESISTMWLFLHLWWAAYSCSDHCMTK